MVCSHTSFWSVETVSVLSLGLIPLISCSHAWSCTVTLLQFYQPKQSSVQHSAQPVLFLSLAIYSITALILLTLVFFEGRIYLCSILSDGKTTLETVIIRIDHVVWSITVGNLFIHRKWFALGHTVSMPAFEKRVPAHTHQNTFNLLFIGSSSTEEDLFPEIFDHSLIPD